MNNNQNAALKMLQSVNNLLELNKSKLDNVQVLNAIAVELKGFIDKIIETDTNRSGIQVKASTNEKQLAENSMIAHALVVANITYVYAFDTANQQLAMQTNVSKSQFYKLHDNDEISLARNISLKAEENKVALANYGLTDEMLNNLNQEIKKFEALIVGPSGAVADRKGQTKSLSGLFVEAKSLLSDRMDKLMIIFESSDPQFYDAYFTARKVVNTAYRKEEKK